MRRVIGRSLAAAALVGAAGILSACQGSAAPAANPSKMQTVATVSPTSTTTTSPVADKAKVPHTLPNCGAARDPFDPSAAVPPTGSPARC